MVLHLTITSPLDFPISLGKRKFLGSNNYPVLKHNSKNYDDEWDILQANAKKPNVEVLRNQTHFSFFNNFSLMPASNKKVYRTYGYKEGDGTYGSVFRVIDTEYPEKELVMKISLANSYFFNEIACLKKLNQEKKTPNIPYLHDWFITNELPPKNRFWGKITEQTQKASFYDNSKSSQQIFGFIIMERANSGLLSSFSEKYLSTMKPQDAWKVIDSLIFQLVFTVSAMPESSIIHRDIGGSNIMISKVHDDNRWWYFRVGKELFKFPRPSFKPIFIDYGSSNILNLGCNLKTTFRYTTLRYRAPEMIFLSCSSSGLLQPSFTPSTDLFSIALTIIEMVLGCFTKKSQDNSTYKNHPFLKHNPPSILITKFEELANNLSSSRKQLNLSYSERTWFTTISSGFITKDESKLLARYVWGMYCELGIPNNNKWPGVEDTHVWKVMNDVITYQKNNNLFYPSQNGFLLSKCEKLRTYLSEQQISSILSMLRYNPKHRPSTAAILKSEIFDEFRISDNRNNIKPCWIVKGSHNL